uniref:MADF domain-containing protein n=1 Tax=Timema poppense TaxID=170557 RepID=A0A7R9H6Y2_TIMPO|nr:unnamed protein product [Timema poppensis]
MKDDPDFNIHFVALIERRPCIYDYTSSDYSKRNVQDKAWETIAKEISESVEACKDRWKNLRGCYTRHLKSLITPSGSGARTKKPYYLAGHLQFLQPFTKSRKSQGNISTTQPVIYSLKTEQTQEEHDVDNNFDKEPEDARTEDRQTKRDISPKVASKPSEDNSFRTQASKKQKKTPKCPTSIAEINRSASDYFESKNTSCAEMNSDDPDLAFVKSVLPDMKEMNNYQKRRFKIGILNLAGQILSEYKPTVSPVLSASSASSTTMNPFD